ncbi:glycerol-3-phosphate 1-O-acyltransferase PlsY [Nitrospira sp. Kam-Ns4a]
MLAVGGYLLGSVPFGVLVAKGLGKPDPRTAGSRNIGFTNVLRVCGKTAGVLTLIGDVGKGWVVAATAAALLEHEGWMLAAALAPVLGHLFPIFLGFRGGKGVATAMGAVLGVAPPVGFGLLLVWLASVGFWRYSSGGALAAFAALPVLGLLLHGTWSFLLFSLLLSGLITVRHKDNIIRLWHGTEPKLGRPSLDV